ncbi:molybdopterin-dependent oxidoreductase alpha subunit [Pseudacidovorax intermedius]|uniref:Molybdopterin-dependent oxidoreductase alpha subunit n=2 Tax=Pseudacidovorax intermedius TaxID=433924 RepID=A0A370FHV9_9BURK|nr:molybdopterin-dependent oxidoreductase alpha subunit [Pseudacidovorax intermedius]
MAAGGWQSLKAVARYTLEEGNAALITRALLQQNKTDGFACVSCAWAKPAEPRVAEFCENGAKATAWELTSRRLSPEFFDTHPVSELRGWSDHDLEAGGRLTAPMRYDRATDRYVEVTWDEAIADIAARLRALRAEDPKSAVFYASGRASLETSYAWQLFARVYGNNNLPDSSNMCHESTSVALPESIGVPIGTVHLEDFGQADCLLFVGQNPGVNSPRMLHLIKEARDRGVPIISFNPLRESGLVRFVDPQSPMQMLTPASTTVSTQYLQVKVGGDLAAMTGVAKALLTSAVAGGQGLDREFIAQHTHGFDAFAAWAMQQPWEDIERESGLARAALERVAAVLGGAKAVIAVYGMGLTQHRLGVKNVQMLCNLLLMGGHMGRPGAGICPVRGHSNVQGQRTVGITEKPELAPLDQLAAQYVFKPPRDKGLDTVGACQGVLDGSVRAMLNLGGNLLRSVPDNTRLEPAWSRLALTVHVATKLNHTHLVPGETSYLLPCIGRIEIDRQAGREQRVSMEDSTGFIHASQGVAEPADERFRSELAIVSALAEATVGDAAQVPWAGWREDYARVRAAIATTYPKIFHDFETRFVLPGGFPKPNAARERDWKTPTGKANFIVPGALVADPDAPGHPPQTLRLMTMRSDDQFNTTIYSLDDRFRDVSGTRNVLFMNEADIARHGLQAGQRIDVRTAADDGVVREVRGLTVRAYDIPEGCVAGYYPECNPLVPLWHHAEGSHVPAYKSVPILVQPENAIP